jgi:hypothetical protein
MQTTSKTLKWTKRNRQNGTDNNATEASLPGERRKRKEMITPQDDVEKG